ncbi:hypothetical protein AGMMS49982_11540 [Bacteroidia bacterium]|nr:hypothetical protein AGMMS49982_11540 [Bacteroidia bacterium]
MDVIVKNLPGTANEHPRGYDSWIAYWEDKTGLKATVCYCIGCNKPAVVGAHVQKVYGSDTNTYIIPLCHECNMKTDQFKTSDSELVRVPEN